MPTAGLRVDFPRQKKREPSAMPNTVNLRRGGKTLDIRAGNYEGQGRATMMVLFSLDALSQGIDAVVQDKMARLEGLSIQPSLFDLFYEEFLNQFMAGSNSTTAAQEQLTHKLIK